MIQRWKKEKKDVGLEYCHEIFDENAVSSDPINIEVSLENETSIFESEEPRNYSNPGEEYNITEGHLHEINLNIEENQTDTELILNVHGREDRHQVKEDDWDYKRAKLLREKGHQYKVED